QAAVAVPPHASTRLGPRPMSWPSLHRPTIDRSIGTRARSTPRMALARVQNFSVSLDGFGTGEPQSLESPFGHAGQKLHEWMFATRYFHGLRGDAGGTGGV